MSFYVSFILQAALTILNALTVAMAHNPEVQKVLVVAISAIQAVLAAIAHQYNPDGTPAKVAYSPK